MWNKTTKCFAVLVLIVVLVFPMMQDQILFNNSEIEIISQEYNVLNPLATPVAPINPEIHYSGDPGGAYSPEPQQIPTGPQTLIVLLVYFSDLSYKESVSTFNSLIFENVSDYYQEISYGQSSITGTVAGWYNLGNSRAYYGADGDTSGVIDDVDDDGDNDSWRLVDDAIAVADPVVDFSSYGHIMVVHAGNGQESSGASDDIWSVRWSWPGHFRTDEKTFDSCSIVPETQGGNVDRCIGVIAHEFGHDIGLPDLYHYGKSGSDDLVGIWGLMASGSWGGSPSGTKPTHMTAYSKLMLDWYTDSEVYDLVSGTFEGSLTASSNQTSGLRVIRYNVTSDYYYLVEARYRSGYDEGLSQSGILITRVDTTKGSGQGIVQVRSDWIYDLSTGSWTPGEEFVDEVSGFAVLILSQEGTSFRVRVTSNPLDGWLNERQLSLPGYTNYSNPVMATNSTGSLYCAYMVWDTDLGHYTISVMVSSDGGYSWSYGFGFYSTTMSYINPTLVIDPYDDMIYIAFERTDGLNHNLGLARFYANHDLYGFSTIATDARDPSIAVEYVYGSTNWLMLAYEKWTDDTSSVINVDRSTDHGTTWTTQSTHSINTFSLDPEIVGSYGYDGIQRWHLIYLEGNTLSNITTIIASRSSNYFANHAGWFSTYSCTISHPTVTAIRGSPEVLYAWSVNRFEDIPVYQHDIQMWYSSDNGDHVNWLNDLSFTTSDEKYPRLGVDSQDTPRYEKGLAYLTYFNGDNVCVRRIYYDRPSVLGKEEVLSTNGYAGPDGIAISTHYVGKHFYPVVAWLNNTADHEIICAVPGYYLNVGMSTPGYPIIVNGQSYTCPVSLGLMFGYSYDIEIPTYYSITSLERLRFDYWLSLPDGKTSSIQNFTLDTNRFVMQYEIMTVTQFKWILEYVGDYFYFSSGWVDAGISGHFNAAEPPSNSTTRYVFSHWSGNVSGTDNSESSTIVITGPVWAYAHWVTQYYIIVITDHSSSLSTGWYNKSLMITVSIVDEYVLIDSGSRWLFDSWSGNATGSVYSASEPFLVDGSKTIYANWQIQYFLTIESDYGTSSGTGWYDLGSTAYAGLDAGIFAGDTGIQYVFLIWAGDSTGSNYVSSDAIVMNGPKTATANWQTQYYFTVVSSHATPAGDGWYGAGEMAYAGLDTGIVAGITGERFVFQSWSGDSSGTNYIQSDAITMDSPKTANAVWQTEYYLTISSAHGTSSGEGWYASSSNAYASLDTGLVPGGTGTRYVFISWDGDTSGSNYASSNVIIMDSPKTALANWQTDYYLSVVSTYGAPTGANWYAAGTLAYTGLDVGIVQGSTGQQFVFQSWSGDSSGTNYLQSDVIIMDGPKTANAVWQTEYYLTVSSTHGESSGEGWYASGYTAYAGLDAGIVAGDTGIQYVFLIWSDDSTGSNFASSDAIVMNGPKTATAVWQTQYYLTVVSSHATPTGDGWYSAGAIAHAGLDAGTVAGITGERFVFQIWNGDTSGTDYSQSDVIVMDGPKTTSAVWQTEYYLTVSSTHGTSSGEGWYASSAIAYAGLDIGIIPVTTGEQIRFQSWSGDSSGSDYSQSDDISMDSPKTATAIWQTEYYLTISSTHGTPSGEGWYVSGSLAYAGGDSSGTNYLQSDDITMDGPKTAAAVWQTEYYLIVSSTQGTPSGEGWYISGATVYASLDIAIVSGITGERFVFQSWSEDASGLDYSQSEEIVMDSPKTATAIWQTEYYLTVTSAHGIPSGEGWYASGNAAYASLDADTIAGITGERFVFQRWTRDASGLDYLESNAITMDGPKTASALWLTQYQLICETDPPGMSPAPVISPLGEWFENGTSVTLEAQVISGYVFDRWEVDGSAQTQGVISITVAMNAPHTIVAWYLISQTPTDTTPPTTPATTPPPQSMGDPMTIILVAGVGVGCVVIIILVVLRKRNA
ncbi:MAG: M6 family metalloprotease domain-containing protein [Candidatus Thorarchaeota archaeon]